MSPLLRRIDPFEAGIVSTEPLRIYTGILGQIGDIVMFTATARRLRELFPNSSITFAVSGKYREAGDLVVGLPYIDRVFVTENYFEKMTPALSCPWHLGWPVDLRGEDEIEEQRNHHLVLETRPIHRRMPWWTFSHLVAELAHMVGVPGPIDCRTEVAIPSHMVAPQGASNRIVVHNDPCIDTKKAWPWESLQWLVRQLGPEQVVMLGNPGPTVPGACDLRGRTSLAEAAAIPGALEFPRMRGFFARRFVNRRLNMRLLMGCDAFYLVSSFEAQMISLNVRMESLWSRPTDSLLGSTRPAVSICRPMGCMR